MFHRRLLIITLCNLAAYIAALAVMRLGAGNRAFFEDGYLAWTPFLWMGLFAVLFPLFFENRQVLKSRKYLGGTVILAFVNALGILFITLLFSAILAPGIG